MASEAELIIVVPRGSAVDRQLHQDPPPSVASGRVAVERAPADAEGGILPPAAGEEVLSVLSPEALSRDASLVSRVIGQAGANGGPLVVIVQVAEELREEELTVVMAAATRARRPVVLAVLGST